MPIFIGASTKNQQQISLGSTQMGKVYVGDKLVWQKPSGFTGIKYGLLYNWYAATDSRKITSSDDWVVPTDAQNVILQNYIGGYSNGGKLKETGLTYWQTPNTGATNELGFNGRGTGRRDNIGSFTAITQFYNAWTSSSTNATEAKYSYLGYNNTTFGTGSSIYKVNGNPIRILYTGVGTPTSYTGNDGKVYRVVTIGSQTWLADNLAETKYRNGDWISGYDSGTYTPISNATWAALTTGAMCVYGDVESNMLL